MLKEWRAGATDFWSPNQASFFFQPYASLNRYGVYLAVLGLSYAAIFLFFWFGFLVVDCLCFSISSSSYSVLVLLWHTILMPGKVSHVYFTFLVFWEWELLSIPLFLPLSLYLYWTFISPSVSLCLSVPSILWCSVSQPTTYNEIFQENGHQM